MARPSKLGLRSVQALFSALWLLGACSTLLGLEDARDADEGTSGTGGVASHSGGKNSAGGSSSEGGRQSAGSAGVAEVGNGGLTSMPVGGPGGEAPNGGTGALQAAGASGSPTSAGESGGGGISPSGGGVGKGGTTSGGKGGTTSGGASSGGISSGGISSGGTIASGGAGTGATGGSSGGESSGGISSGGTIGSGGDGFGGTLSRGGKTGLGGRIIEPCFVAGTPVTLADGRTQAIELVRVDDEVLSFDPESGRFLASRVVQTFVHPNSPALVVIDHTLVTTPEHRFYAQGAWKPAASLVPGADQLSSARLTTRPGADEASNLLELSLEPHSLTSIELRAGGVTTYNLEVVPAHTYFAASFLVHNIKQQPQ